MRRDTKFNISKGIDTQLVIIYLVLVIIGWLAIYSSSYNPEIHSTNIFDLSKNYGKQLIWIASA
ncbi:MAG TPA: rod shape-determining protein RodA, partial [Bacteroidales bacterium]|nr:rod shape-determining protein RodA [Bacteroidales bacterium]